MRQKPQDLAGPLTTTPQASLVDTFAPGDLSLAGKAPVQQELLDFSTLSNAAKKLIDQRREFNEKEGEKAGLKVGSMLETGATDAEAYAAIVESGDTPRTIASKFAKAAKGGKIDAVDLPGFKVGLARAKGAFVAGQMKSTAESLISKYAAQHSQLAPGDDEGEDALIREAFAEMRGANQEDLEGLDFFGKREAEPMLQDLALKFLDKVRGESRTLQMEQRKDLVGIDISEWATTYMAKGTTDDEQAEIIAKMGALESELRLEGIDGKTLIAEKAIAAAGSLALTEGWEKAGEFLEKVHLNARGPAGENEKGAYVFRDNPNMDLLRAIDQAEMKKERDRDTKGQKLATMLRDTAINVETSEGIKTLVNAYTDSNPDAIRQATSNAIKAVESGDPEALAQFNLTPETARFAPAIIRDLEQSALQDAKSYRADVYQSVRSEVLAVALDKSPEEALASLSGLGLRPSERIQLGEEIRALQSQGVGKAFSQVMQTGIVDQIRYAVAATLPQDSPLAQERANQEVGRFLEEFVAAGYGDDNPLQGPAAYKLGFDYIEAMKKRYTPTDAEAQRAQETLRATEGNTVKAQKFLEQAEGYRNDVVATKNATSSTILGGIRREEAPENIASFEGFLANRPAKDYFRTSGDARTAAKRVKEIMQAKGIPEEQKPAAATEAALRLGLVPLLSLSTEDIDLVKTQVQQGIFYNADHPAGSAGLNLPWLGSAQSASTKTGGGNKQSQYFPDKYTVDMSGWEELDLSTVNPFLTPFPDFRDAAEYLISDPSDSDINRFNPLKPLGDHKRAAIENFLEATGIVANDDSIKDFLQSQSELWK